MQKQTPAPNRSPIKREGLHRDQTPDNFAPSLILGEGDGGRFASMSCMIDAPKPLQSIALL